MILKTVTITGADDSVEPKDIIELSQIFPFVEWGILLSATSMGRSRFPSRDWMERLAADRQNPGLDENVRLSAHVCGRWVREILQGQPSFIDRLGPEIWSMFARCQINTHGEHHEINNEGFIQTAHTLGKHVLIQFDGVNNRLYNILKVYDVRVYPFFDMSHGAGVLPKNWTAPILPSGSFYCGYAGGLGPDNLADQLVKIEEAADKIHDTPLNVWVDMETKVRSQDDRQFDIEKVYKCLEIAKAFMDRVPEEVKDAE